MRTLSDLLGAFKPPALSEKDAAITISGISADSRVVREGEAFYALSGVHVDGSRFIADAIRSGARAVVHESSYAPSEDLRARAVFVAVSDTHKALSYGASVWFGNPAAKLCNIGVTGTDGKSSTVYFIQQILEYFGLRAGFISTVSIKVASTVDPNSLRQSTPEALELHRLLAEMVEQGITHAVIEATSHGLSDRTARLADVPFSAGVFTNLSHEHLEFHGSFEQYRSDKANLFRRLSANGPVSPFGVVNAGDAAGSYMISQCSYPVRSYWSEFSTLKPESIPDIRAEGLKGDAGGVDFELVRNIGEGRETRTAVRIPLPGFFNVENVLAAVLCSSGVLGVEPEAIIPALSVLRAVKGRMRPIEQGQGFSVIVDYAHTPGAYEKVFPMFRKSAGKRLIAVFGSAGERDREKRPMQGRIAARYSDVLVLCNEDPRLEDENAIIGEIKAGAESWETEREIHCVPDRREAIRTAFRLAEPGDLVVLLGKGHEQSIIYPEGKRPWDEENVAREVLSEMGWKPSGLPAVF